MEVTLYEKNNHTFADVNQNWAAWNIIDQALTLIPEDEAPYKFFNTADGSFLRGFTPRIVGALQRANYKVNWFSTGHTVRNPQHGPVSGELQHLQPWAVEEVAKHEYGLIDIATRFGKSYLYAGWYARMGRPMTLITVPRAAIASQMKKELEEFLGEPVGLIAGSVSTKKTWQNFTIAIEASLCDKSGQVYPEHLPYLQSVQARIRDECHIQGKLLHVVNAAMPYVIYSFGSSATPKVSNEVTNWVNEGWYGPSRIRISSKCLADRGILAQVKAVMHKFQHVRHPTLDWIDLYKTGIVHNVPRNQLIANIAKAQINSGRCGLIFINYTAHGEELKKEIPGSVIVSSKHLTQKESEEIKELFNSGKVRCVIVTKKWREGVTLRSDFGINAEGMQADHVTIQKLGRGLLPKTHGEPLFWHDILDGGNRTLYKHAQARLNTLKREEWEVGIFEENAQGDNVRNALLELEQTNG